ncbi:MAG TPA: RidA family protein [Bacteroidales bacterium]|nr:RidA family protein [Bacteroidales bacterium]
MKTERRSAIKKMFATLIGVAGVGVAAKAAAAPSKKESMDITTLNDGPLFAGVTKYGNLLFLSGIGAHVAPFTIEEHTKIVLKGMEDKLKEAGSSMEKVLKVNVYLNDIADYKAMNETYKGHFGANPPVRTTVAVAKGGVPGDSLVEMDCIAYI